MPNIPTYLPDLPMGQSPGRPNLVDVPTGRGVSAANYINAIGLPTVSNETFMGDVRANAALGEAVSQVGGMLGQLAEKEIQAKNYADVSAAEDRLKTRFAEWENNKPQGAPDTWAQSWKNESELAIKEIMNDRSLSQSAKEELQIRLGRFSTNAHIQVASDAAKAQFQRAASANNAQTMRYVADGQDDLARASKAEAVKNGWAYEDDLATLEIQIENRKKAEEFDALLLEIDRDPDAAAKIYESKRESLPFDKQLQAERALKASRNQRTYFDGEQEAQVATESLAMLPPEKLKTATIDDLGVKWERATPYQKFTVQKKLEMIQGKLQMNDPVEFEQAITAAMNYDPTDDPTQIKGAQFEARAEAMFDGPMLSRIKDALKKANEGQMGDDTLLASVRKDVMASATMETTVEKPVTQTVDGKELPVMRDARKIGETAEVEKTGIFGWDWIAMDEPAKAVYEDGTATATDADKPKVPVVEKVAVPAPKENLLKAKAVTDELERAWKNPTLREKFIKDPRELERLRDDLLRRQGLPLPTPAAVPSLFPPPPPGGYGTIDDAKNAIK